MTKKDYELIAEVLKEYIHLEWNNLSRPATSIAQDLADVFASENERFDYNKFMEACIP
jgi:hypothetical protein|tara:strand:+ start:2162 stop:2335 length:174 start_codon:yes stop_codon:yes gene_type:complete